MLDQAVDVVLGEADESAAGQEDAGQCALAAEAPDVALGHAELFGDLRRGQERLI